MFAAALHNLGIHSAEGKLQLEIEELEEEIKNGEVKASVCEDPLRKSCALRTAKRLAGRRTPVDEIEAVAQG